ncbi:MAG: VWA domain-containing protein [Cyanobacteria bacterium HKST-UBA05]|nr:VWA domain-containing protein [Cyanobacteria bacterium HKST-UBA05]
MLAMATIMFGMMTGTLFIDLPVYFNTYRQLQTVVDSAALAGAAQLPHGIDEAQAEALRVAKLNPLQGLEDGIEADDLTFTADSQSLTVHASVDVPTIFGKFLCQGDCLFFPVAASAKALPAARDTMLVLDNSSSMNDLGNNRPMRDVKDAAELYVDEVEEFDSQSVDRIGVVTFNRTSAKRIGLTGKNDAGGFAAVKDEVQDIQTYNGSGWNTNYYVGLKEALDELEQNGRENANKHIIFLTDGAPNLPGPPTYAAYDQYNPLDYCLDPLHASPPVQNACYYQRYSGRWYRICPYLPSEQITDSMIENQYHQCGLDYVGYMDSLTQGQVQRAKNMGVKITTITIDDPNQASNSHAIIQRIIKDRSWDSGYLEYASSETGGASFAAAAYDSQQIAAIYEDIANDIHIKLVKVD